MPFNRTKIVATLGPASDNLETVIKLIDAGVDVFRLNFSHGKYDILDRTIKCIEEANEHLGTNVGILADLQGPKIRLGLIEGGSVSVNEGDQILLCTYPTEGTKEKMHVTYEELARDVYHGQRILIDDGKMELRVLHTNGHDEVLAEVMNKGVISSKKGINLPDTAISAPALSPKDMEDLQFIFKYNINWIALSFVRTAEEIQHLKGIVQFNKHNAKIIAKIERPEAITNIESIINTSDAVMVARGDLGVELPVERIPILQKDIVNKCRYASKPVIIATQMMESMIKNPMPSRAEVTDVANAIFDGADALMLSGETAMGDFPVRVVQTFTRIIENIEMQTNIFHRYHAPRANSPTFMSDVVCHNACKMAADFQAKAIVGVTKSGYTAFTVSSQRPEAPIFIFTDNKQMLNMYSLIWGVMAFYYNKAGTTEETLNDLKQILTERKYVKKGDIIIHTMTVPLKERGRTNTIKVSVVNGG